MATLTLSIPDDLLRQARSRLGPAADAPTVEEYLLSVLQSLALEGEPIDADTEAKLLDGLATPARSLTDSDWTAKLNAYDQRQARPKEP